MGATTDSSANAPRPLRADAERNRRKILDAAREVFAERGLVSLDEVAEHAGVGVGTVYRRFASRDELIDELYRESVGRIVSAATAAAELSETEPWQALVAFLTDYLEIHAEDRSLSSVVLTDAHGRGGLEMGKSQMAPLGQRIVGNAKAAGVLRDDFSPTDIPATVVMLVSLMNATREVDPELWRRYLALALSSWRPGGHALELPGPALGFEQVPSMMRAAFSGGR
ncbi:MAG: TetR/AcrR family transcriptional regulator [Patulibacter minatonensis]